MLIAPGHTIAHSCCLELLLQLLPVATISLGNSLDATTDACANGRFVDSVGGASRIELGDDLDVTVLLGYLDDVVEVELLVRAGEDLVVGRHLDGWCVGV